MIVSFIVAMDGAGTIGKDNGLPWRISADLKDFKKKTLGKPVIMGRKTYDSIGRPLPQRPNIVVTRNKDLRIDGATVVGSVEAALDAARAAGAEEAMVIGGAEIYGLMFPVADRLYITEVAGRYEGDAWFPEFDRAAWKEVSRIDHAPEAPGGPAFSFVVLDRR